MLTVFSLCIGVATLITDILALVLNLAEFCKGRDGPMESEKSETATCRIEIPLELLVRGSWILVEIHGPDSIKKPHPVAGRDEEGR